MTVLARVLSSTLVAVALGAACNGEEGPPPPKFGACKPPQRLETAVTLVPAFGDRKFERPVELVEGPERRFYVVEQAGRIQVVPPGGGNVTVALESLVGRIVTGGESGLLGLAFDPDFATNGFAYVYYTEKRAEKPQVVFQDVLARFTSRDGGLTFDPASEKVLLEIDDPFSNHNGGKLAFGPDRMLYVGLGDGGSAGDPNRNAQNKDALLGKILRIDPHAADPYGIPPTNPFAAGGGRGEIYAYGIRNPWKFSFDRATGELWLADVGQSKYEEIDRVVLGGNYGWNTREGRHCFAVRDCSAEGLIDPVAEYTRTDGTSITGGYVYRGTRIPSLAGKFVYGDFGSGNIWSVDGAGQATGTLLTGTSMRISTFGQDSDGEIYVADYGTGTVKQLAAGEVKAPAASATLLSETGCLDPKAPAAAPAGAIAYTVNSPLWSDGASKDRWLFVEEGQKIGVLPDGDLEVPPASVAVKTFTVAGKRVETRLFVRYGDGGWAGYSYEWADDGSDATLLTTGKTKDLGGGQSWTYPSPGDCFGCHTSAAGYTLGLEARQLNREENGANVLDRFAPVLATPIGKEQFPPLPAADTEGASAEERARGYLHANCSSCHRDGAGSGAATFDLRADRPLEATRTCNVRAQGGDLGLPEAKIVHPGDPARSTLALRMRALDGNRMPNIGTRVVDEVGAAAVEEWIRGLACP